MREAGEQRAYFSPFWPLLAARGAAPVLDIAGFPSAGGRAEAWVRRETPAHGTPCPRSASLADSRNLSTEARPEDGAGESPPRVSAHLAKARSAMFSAVGACSRPTSAFRTPQFILVQPWRAEIGEAFKALRRLVTYLERNTRDFIRCDRF
jgi:hypothetical protein